MTGQGEGVSKRGGLGWVQGRFCSQERRCTERRWCRIPTDPRGAASTDGAAGVPARCREWELTAFRGPFRLRRSYSRTERRANPAGRQRRRRRTRTEQRGSAPHLRRETEAGDPPKVSARPKKSRHSHSAPPTSPTQTAPERSAPRSSGTAEPPRDKRRGHTGGRTSCPPHTPHRPPQRSAGASPGQVLQDLFLDDGGHAAAWGRGAGGVQRCGRRAPIAAPPPLRSAPPRRSRPPSGGPSRPRGWKKLLWSRSSRARNRYGLEIPPRSALTPRRAPLTASLSATSHISRTPPGMAAHRSLQSVSVQHCSFREEEFPYTPPAPALEPCEAITSRPTAVSWEQRPTPTSPQPPFRT